MNNYKTIGIIGGQGPVSTADFYLLIIKYFQDHFGARYVRDFPPMVIFSVPTPDLVEGIENEDLTLSLITEAAKKIQQDGASFIVIACNSLQYLIPKIQKHIAIPILEIAPIVTRYVQENGYKKVGVLATNTTIEQRIYDRPLEKLGIQLLTPEQKDQLKVEEIILNEIGGDTKIGDSEDLIKIISRLKEKGAEAIVLGCTELPLIVSQAQVEIPLIDPNELYAVETARVSSALKDMVRRPSQ